MDHHYRENSARNIYSNYNQMLSTFPSSNRRNFEDSGIVLAVSVSQFYQSIAVQLQQLRLNKMVITTVCTNRQLFL